MRSRAALAGALPLLLAAACAGPAAESGAPSEPAVYEMRGVVRQLPRPGGQLMIHHEAVPGFVDERGEAVGMQAMTMPFEVGREVDLEGLAVGDKVGFRLQVDWDGSPAVLITRIERLAAETPLEL